MSLPDQVSATPQIEITLRGRSYTMRPEFGALERIETQLGLGITLLQQRAQLRQVGVSEVARVVYEGIRQSEGNGAPAYQDVGRMVAEEGLNTLIGPAMEFLSAAMLGFRAFAEAAQAVGDSAEEEETPPGATDPSSPPASDASPAASTGGASSASPSPSASSPESTEE